MQVTSSSSNSKGLYTNGLHSTITMTGGTVTGELALNAENGGHIKVTDVSLTTTNGNGGGAGVDSANSMIELYMEIQRLRMLLSGFWQVMMA
ncbi:hypothetical protein [Bartonella grahamii]|uniref:Uncharacterized protein n=1 Tax=Bartonella grahamii TaxID=33045 RepID=A0A336NGE7_BARGR|nr:hypothetical protein [Bartonella grahamii]SSZ40740.1 Uncharacterised protein [Bartonella grahamii]